MSAGVARFPFLAEALESRAGSSGPVTWFFRNDDAGWDTPRLLRLLDLFAAHDAPLDAAVIPAALTAELAAVLRTRATRQRLGLHQHGHAHLNHEVAGRKCEFGAARSAAAQRADLAAGRAWLQSQLGSALDDIFTPPWNRCTQPTVEALRDLGIRVLSREHRATPLAADGLAELPVHVDWMKWRTAAADGPDLAALDQALVQAVATTRPGTPVGLMLHHAVMADADFAALDGLLAQLAKAGATWQLMREASPTTRGPGAQRAGGEDTWARRA